MPVKTSIIIPCHNAALTLDLQLESIHRQEGAEPFEVLVVLNNCTDNSAQLIENWRNRLDIQAIEANEFAGASYARNVGVRHARGTLLIFCDADDVLSAHYVANAQRALSEKEIFCGGYPAVPEKYFNTLESALSFAVEAPYATPDESEFDARWPIFPGGSFGITKDLMIRLGGFDPVYEPGAEDNEFGYRAFAAGFTPGTMRASCIAYRVPAEQRKPLKLLFRRAKSAALLIDDLEIWKANPITRGHNPALSLLRSLLSAVGVFSGKKDFSTREYTEKIATQSGIFMGWVEYKMLHKKPESLRGWGL